MEGTVYVQRVRNVTKIKQPSSLAEPAIYARRENASDMALCSSFFPQLVLNTARGTYIQDLPNALNSYLSVIPQQQQDSNRPAKGNLRKHGFYVRFREALIKRDSKKPSEFKWRKHCASVVFGT